MRYFSSFHIYNKVYIHKYSIYYIRCTLLYHLNTTPVDGTDEGQGLDPIAIYTELDRVVLTVIISQGHLCISIIEQLMIASSLLEQVCDNISVLLFGLRKTLLIESDILIHGQSLFIEYLNGAIHLLQIHILAKQICRLL